MEQLVKAMEQTNISDDTSDTKAAEEIDKAQRKEYNRLVKKARSKEETNGLTPALKYYRQALAIVSSEKLQRKIEKLQSILDARVELGDG